jgi:Family of unknown function (DUF5681)/Bacterial regulatory helix-turn-helix protein, lysR family
MDELAGIRMFVRVVEGGSFVAAARGLGVSKSVITKRVRTLINPNLTEVSKPTQWKPGQSGNANGRPVGSRQVFSAAFLSDLAAVWQEHGKDTMLHTAKNQPTTFFAVCSRLIPSDVKLTVEQTFAGLSGDDYALLKEIVFAVRQAILDASSQPPGKVLAHVLGALRNCPEKNEKRTVLFASAKSVNDLKGRFCN